jgi:hypothetical protein
MELWFLRTALPLNVLDHCMKLYWIWTIKLQVMLRTRKMQRTAGQTDRPPGDYIPPPIHRFEELTISLKSFIWTMTMFWSSFIRKFNLKYCYHINERARNSIQQMGKVTTCLSSSQCSCLVFHIHVIHKRESRLANRIEPKKIYLDKMLSTISAFISWYCRPNTNEGSVWKNIFVTEYKWKYTNIQYIYKYILFDVFIVFSIISKRPSTQL